MPLLRMAMYAQGIELYYAPTVDDRDTWLPTMRMIALEGRCFVLSACQYLTLADCPPGYAAALGDDPKDINQGRFLHYRSTRENPCRADFRGRDDPVRGAQPAYARPRQIRP